jgi:hypothetical protein
MFWLSVKWRSGSCAHAANADRRQESTRTTIDHSFHVGAGILWHTRLCDQSSRSFSQGEYLLRLVLMCRYVGLGFGQLTRCFRSHRSLLLENLALRQQLAVAEAQASPTPDGSG